MSGYIRDDVINALYEQADDEGWWVATASQLETLINSFRAADVAPVVRCKDCKWYEAENHNCLDTMGYTRVWNPDDYCSFGERRDADAEE